MPDQNPFLLGTQSLKGSAKGSKAIGRGQRD